MPKHDQLPPKKAENAEGGMEFPCEMDIKVFTKAESAFLQHIRGLLELILEPVQIIEITKKQSSKGKYHSLSCKVHLFDKKQADQVFKTLSEHPDIVMVL